MIQVDDNTVPSATMTVAANMVRGLTRPSP